MFDKSNSLSDVKSYYKESLNQFFSENEIKHILKSLCVKSLDISDLEYIESDNVKLSESDILYFKTVVSRLKKEEPFQYIIGECWFFDLNLKIDERALIPRPETEELVYWMKEVLPENIDHIADLCSGSGCIALALKSVYTNAEISALEISKSAVSLIKENAVRTSLPLNILELDVLKSDDYSVFEKNSFDCWVSNPPYIPNSERRLMSKNVLEFEPEQALFVSDETPLVFYQEIARNALKYLKNNGFLFFEIHEEFESEVVSILEGLGFVNIELRKDLQGKSRMVKAQRVSSPHECE